MRFSVNTYIVPNNYLFYNEISISLHAFDKTIFKIDEKF